MSTLIELTYVSEPAQAMSFLGLMRLLYHSYSNNQALGITGVLIYENDRFGQVISLNQNDFSIMIELKELFS